MSNRRFEMYEYRQVIHRMRMGESDQTIARTKLVGRIKCGQIRAIAWQQGWLDKGLPLPDDFLKEGALMYSGPLVFTQVMDFMPLKTFQRCVERYQGNFSVKNFTCMNQFRIMAFAQLAYRESLRDIEACPPVTKKQALSHGHLQQDIPQHLGRSKRDAGLAYLRRFCPSSDRHRQEALPQGTLGRN